MKAVRPFEPRRGSTLVEQPQFLCRNISGKVLCGSVAWSSSCAEIIDYASIRPWLNVLKDTYSL